jgi:competence protein ComEC
MDSFRDEIRRVPFLKITIPFVVGIVISQEFRLLWSVVFISVIALLWLIFLFKREVLKNCTTFLLLVALGFCAAQAAAPTRQLPRGEKVEALIEVSDGVKFTSRRTRKSTSAYVRAYRTKGDSSWRKSNERVVIYVDTAAQLNVGQLFAAEVYANDLVRDSVTSYSRLMYARGVTSALFVRSQNVRDWNVGYVNSLEYGARIFRNRISERLMARLENRDDGAVLAALLTGDRSHLTPHIKRRYQLAGTSHILALSGMHLSMIFIVFNLLLKPLVLLGRGMNLLKSLVILLIIWGYAYVSGLSLSVCRAAIMITIAQLTLMSTTRANSYNSIFIAAFITLSIWPLALFDISFQLSYAAMVCIVFFVPRFIRWVRVPRCFEWLRNIVAVTLAAQIGVAPLVAASFGTISLASLIINPIVALTTPLIMMFGGVVGVPFTDSICEWIFIIHNGVISLGDSLKWGSIENISLSQVGAMSCYILLIIIMLIIKFRDRCSCLNSRKSEK